MGKVWGGMGVGFTSVAIVVQIRAIREALRVRRGVAFLRGDGAKYALWVATKEGRRTTSEPKEGRRNTKEGRGRPREEGQKGQESQPPAVARTKHQEESLLFL